MDTDQRNETASWADSTAPGPWVAPSPGSILAGRFLLLSELGRGGCGTVYAARDIALDTKIALKVVHPHLVDPSSRERLRREVRSARAKHPNAAAVYDLHEDGRLVFLTMELIEGETLRDRLVRERSLPLDDVQAIASDMAAALAHVHRGGLVHRDVKPGNILLAPDGRAVLCDMGLVRSLEDDVTLTATNFTMGTPAYMAPEQATRTGLSPATDVYALGLTLYQCLVGKLPNAHDSTIQTLMARQRARPPRLRHERPDVPRWLERLVRWMLEPRPEDRPTAEQVARAVDHGRVGLRVTRREVRGAAAALLAVAALGGLGWAVQNERPEDAERVEAVGSEVRGLDERGEVLWRIALRGVVQQTERVDVDLDGRDETVVLAGVDGVLDRRAMMAAQSELLAVRDDGSVVQRLQLADLERLKLTMGADYPLILRGDLHLFDLDRDGTTELVLLLRQHAFYPAALAVYWPVHDRWDVVLGHSGWIYDLLMPEDDPPRLQFLATANLQGHLPAVGEIMIDPPRPGDRQATAGGLHADFIAASEAHRFRWSFYALLPPPSGPATGYAQRLEHAPGGSAYTAPGFRGVIDRWGNPIDSPNAGRDLRQNRLQLQSSLSQLKATGVITDDRSVTSVMAILDEIERRHAELLREPALRVVVDLTAARALARAGAPAAGVQRLSRTAQQWSWEDVLYRLAHLQALTGELPAAAATLAALGEDSSRSEYDGPHLQVRLATEQLDRSAVGRHIAKLQSRLMPEQQAVLTSALWAQARLWWDSSIPADTAVEAYPYAPAGGAIACLARWRLGQLRTDDPAAMRRYAEDNPDARWEAWLAEGAAELGLGQAEAALIRLDELVNVLAPLSHDDFSNLQVLQLARAVRLLALAEAGQPAEAIRQARALRPELTDELLPAILLDELLAETSDDLRERAARLVPIAAP